MERREIYKQLNAHEKAQLGSLEREKTAINSEKNIGKYWTLKSGRVVDGPAAYQHIQNCIDELYDEAEKRIIMAKGWEDQPAYKGYSFVLIACADPEDPFGPPGEYTRRIIDPYQGIYGSFEDVEQAKRYIDNGIADGEMVDYTSKKVKRIEGED